ncbi:MAG: type II secretion system major pseudopilin GspG [Sedimentisphaerales bacterium]|nr:type II secretion system major pseudopilin GspG [Sedimentisphaerales bacterium]
MRRKKDRKNRKAFTLVELLVVIMILALLAGVVAPKFIGQIFKAKRDIARPKMRNIESAIDMYILNTGGQFPSSLEDLLTCPPGLEEVWAGPYLKPKALLDPWDNPYVYVPNGTVNPGSYDLISYGADGAQGGEGDNADIYND